MTAFDSPQPSDATLGEFADYQELLTETGRIIIAVEDDLLAAEQREAARLARRRSAGLTPDAVGRGRV